MTDLDFREQVKKGVAWLDANGPANWHEKIVLKQFCMASGCECVLGFVFRDEAAKDGINGYMFGCELADKVGGSDNWADEHGFDLPFNLPSNYHSRSTAWVALQAEWKDVILDRRAGIL